MRFTRIDLNDDDSEWEYEEKDAVSSNDGPESFQSTNNPPDIENPIPAESIDESLDNTIFWICFSLSIVNIYFKEIFESKIQIFLFCPFFSKKLTFRKKKEKKEKAIMVCQTYHINFFIFFFRFSSKIIYNEKGAKFQIISNT